MSTLSIQILMGNPMNKLARLVVNIFGSRHYFVKRCEARIHEEDTCFGVAYLDYAGEWSTQEHQIAWCVPLPNTKIEPLRWDRDLGPEEPIFTRLVRLTYLGVESTEVGNIFITPGRYGIEVNKQQVSKRYMVHQGDSVVIRSAEDIILDSEYDFEGAT